MKIRAYDPEAIPVTAEYHGRRITFGEDSYQICENAGALIIFTDWQEFRNPDCDPIVKRLKTPLSSTAETSAWRDPRKLYHCELESIR